MKEIWMPVVDYEGLYEVSNMGRVKSLKRKRVRMDTLLTPYVAKNNGYCYVSLSKNGSTKTKRVHSVVMNAFRPVNKRYGYDPLFTIDHIDGDKTNNRLSNLEWCSQAENTRRSVALRRRNYASRKVINLDTLDVFGSEVEAARSVGGRHSAQIHKVCVGLRSHYRNNRFAFLDEYEKGMVPVFNGKFRKRSSETLWVK